MQEQQIAEIAMSIRNYSNKHDWKLFEFECENLAIVLYNLGYRKLPEDSVVLSREEHEMHITQYKNLEIKYRNLSDNYRLCKDANETIKQFAVKARKEAAKEFAEKLKERLCKECSGCYIPNCFETPTDEFAYNAKEVERAIDELSKEYGLE